MSMVKARTSSPHWELHVEDQLGFNSSVLKSGQLKSFSVCVCVPYWTTGSDFITHVTEFYFLDLLSSSVRWITTALKAQITEYF